MKLLALPMLFLLLFGCQSTTRSSDLKDEDKASEARSSDLAAQLYRAIERKPLVTANLSTTQISALENIYTPNTPNYINTESLAKYIEGSVNWISIGQVNVAWPAFLQKPSRGEWRNKDGKTFVMQLVFKDGSTLEFMNEPSMKLMDEMYAASKESSKNVRNPYPLSIVVNEIDTLTFNKFAAQFNWKWGGATIQTPGRSSTSSVNFNGENKK